MPTHLILHPVELSVELLRFRTVAPQAAQGAALHEQRQADARAVMYGKTLNIVKFPGQFFVFHNLLQKALRGGGSIC
jgi:hypothetical protein